MRLFQFIDLAQRFFGQELHAAVRRKVGIVVRHDKRPLFFVRPPAPMLKDISIGVCPHQQAVSFQTVFAYDGFYFIGQPVQFIIQCGCMPVQRYGDVRFYLFHLIRYLTV